MEAFMEEYYNKIAERINDELDPYDREEDFTGADLMELLDGANDTKQILDIFGILLDRIDDLNSAD